MLKGLNKIIKRVKEKGKMERMRHNKNRKEGKERRMEGNEKMQKVELCVRGKEDEENKWWNVG